MQTSEILDHLQDPRQFVCLCRDLLLAEGALNVRGAAKGNDQGADLIADISVHSPVHDETITFLVQCKWYRSGKSIGARVLSDGLSSLDLHRSRGLLIVTSSTFSGTAISHANAISKSSLNPRIVAMWDREEVIRRLRRHPRVAATYVCSTSGSPAKRKRGATTWQARLEDYISSEVPPRYSSNSVATFPEGHLDDNLRGKLELLEATFASNPPACVVIKGGVYSGKSGLAWSLVNKASNHGASFIAVSEFDFKRAFFLDEFRGQSLLPQVISKFRIAKVVFMEDVGSVLRDRSPLQVRAARLLKELLHERISQGRPVILESRDTLSRELREYMDYLAAHGFVVKMPESSVGRSLEKLMEESRSGRETSVRPEGSYYLGRNWLLEKYGKIKNRVESLRRTLLEPEEEHLRAEELTFQFSGDPKRSRVQVAIDELGYLGEEIEEYSGFVEGLPFHAIAFEDGSARLLPRLHGD